MSLFNDRCKFDFTCADERHILSHLRDQRSLDWIRPSSRDLILDLDHAQVGD